ncbi:MAG: type IV pili methyl-accepting chemotaxis transducer N-terminal domain-containing protein [Planctomycetes bacterium]|nr:type IV pili methyl-accepting chemotaxis transducer N-terminal domain-containing protein [Planctomycetota bacterium]
MLKQSSLVALCLAFIMTVAAGPLAAAVSDREWASAINVAGRQRMLSQKMMKELLLVQLGVEAEANRTQLAATAKLFADSHRRLSQGDGEQGIPAPPTPEVKAALGAIDDPWKSFSGDLAAAATGGGATPVLARANEDLLKVVAAMVEVYEQAQKAALGTSTGKVVNWAGRQRMLSQRMAKEALLIAAGIDADGYRGKLAATRALFAASHKSLAEGDAATGIPVPTDPAVKRQFGKIDGLWQDYQRILDQVAGGDVAARAVLAERSLQMLTETNRATSQLEALTK